MTFVGPGPVNCHRGFDEYGGHIARVRSRVRRWIPQLKKTKTIDNGFLASVMALRVLVEGWPSSGSTLIAKGEVDAWQEAYLEWFERAKGHFPKKADPAQVKALALQEFARLRELGVNMPKIIWEGSAHRDRISDQQTDE
jgi:hypothetical protein